MNGSRRTSFVLFWCVLGCAACGGARPGPARTLLLPSASAEQESAFEDVARRAFTVLSEGRPAALLLDDDGLRALLLPEAASSAALVRANSELAMRIDPDAQSTLAAAHYAGVCIQHARVMPPGAGFGLRAPGFTFDRMLVVGAEAGGGRVAAWVEGTFVLTDQGFFAIALQRLESPRRDHADLDLAPCDFRFGLGSPRGVVVSVPASY